MTSTVPHYADCRRTSPAFTTAKESFAGSEYERGTLPRLLAVGVGGALGAMARQGVNAVVHALVPGSTFPLGILVVNVLGSATGQIHLPYAARAFLVVGLLGGFTTFSSFSLDTLAMTRQGQFGAAALNAAGHFALALVGVWAGFRAGDCGSVPARPEAHRVSSSQPLSIAGQTRVLPSQGKTAARESG